MIGEFMACIRPARAGDEAEIAAIYNEGILERGSTFETRLRTANDIRAWLHSAARLPLLVSDQDGRVEGWGRVASYSERPAYAGVGEVSVYVAERARGRGIGRALLRDLASAAERRGYWKLTGKLFPENEASAALVRTCGWREVGLHLRHAELDGRWRDVLVVERSLN
jgi:L-amino acid N-acyltransferase YncA